jgi:hypothetical protein
MTVWEWLSSETAKQTVAFSLFGTLITAAFGAFAGAFLASRGKNKTDLIAELNSVKATLTLCFTICSSCISGKKQIFGPLNDSYQKELHSYHNRGPGLFEFHADLQTITPVKLPNETLERHVFDKIRIQGRPLVAAVTLIGVLDSLEKSVTYRNDLIAEFKATKFPSDKEKAELYFGSQNATGTTNARFKLNIAALAAQIDDCIFFSRLLADDLLTYGNKVIRQNRWKYRLGFSELLPADWSAVEKEGLIPPTEQYANWLKGFKKNPTDALAWMGKPAVGLILLLLIGLFASGVGLTWSFAYSADPILLTFTLFYEALVFGCMALLAIKVLKDEAP